MHPWPFDFIVGPIGFLAGEAQNVKLRHWCDCQRYTKCMNTVVYLVHF